MARVSRSRCSRDARLRAAGGDAATAAAGGGTGAGDWGGAVALGAGADLGAAGGLTGAGASAGLPLPATTGLDSGNCGAVDCGDGVAGVSGVPGYAGAVAGVWAAGIAGGTAATGVPAVAVPMGLAWLHAASRPSRRHAVRVLVTSFHVKKVELIAVE